VQAALDLGTGPLVIDLTAVHTIDATGLGMLIGAQRRATTAGRSVVLSGVPVRVTRLLRATRLDRVLPPEPTASSGIGV
jgi:anti-anti-sigma factor